MSAPRYGSCFLLSHGQKMWQEGVRPRLASGPALRTHTHLTLNHFTAWSCAWVLGTLYPLAFPLRDATVNGREVS